MNRAAGGILAMRLRPLCDGGRRTEDGEQKVARHRSQTLTFRYRERIGGGEKFFFAPLRQLR